MKQAVKLVKDIFSGIRKAIRLSKRTINRKENEKIKITEIDNESTI